MRMKRIREREKRDEDAKEEEEDATSRLSPYPESCWRAVATVGIGSRPSQRRTEAQHVAP